MDQTHAVMGPQTVTAPSPGIDGDTKVIAHHHPAGNQEGRMTTCIVVKGRRPVAAEVVTVALLERAQDPSRVLALSDGVFAIIIALLVLEIHVPELTQATRCLRRRPRSGRRSTPSRSASSRPACTGSATATCSR
jgi:transmembrane protein TMEM174 (potassium channel)